MADPGVSAKTGWCIIGGYVLASVAVVGLMELGALPGSVGGPLIGLGACLGIPVACYVLRQYQRDHPAAADVHAETPEDRGSPKRRFSWIVAGYCLFLAAIGLVAGLQSAEGLGLVLAACIMALLHLPVPRWCRVTAAVIAVVVVAGVLVFIAIVVCMFLIDPPSFAF